jgi:hypothetical protein
VAKDATADVMDRILSDIPVVQSARDSLAAKSFAGTFDFALASAADDDTVGSDYKKASEGTDNLLARYVIRDQLPGPNIHEHWRNVVVDVTQPKPDRDVTSDEFLDELGEWLVDNQPITVAYNGDYNAGRRLWERTGQVVFTVGTLDNPALTCQARPQDGEVFGEFPVRLQLQEHTTFPVIVPSPTPAYNASYSSSFLHGEATKAIDSNNVTLATVAAVCNSKDLAGYLGVLHDYLSKACGPKRGHGDRSALYGLQTPPQNGQLTQVRIGAEGSFDDAIRSIFPLWVTNARSQICVSVDPSNVGAIEKCKDAGLSDALVIEDDEGFECAIGHRKPYNIIKADDTPPALLPLVGQFVSTLVCVGHVKSTAGDDDAFFNEFVSSSKWLTMQD